MPVLHYHPGDASMIAHIVLEECGAPFALEFVDRAQAAHKSPEYLKLNPNGLIPVLIDGDLVLYETAAICLHLADANPSAALIAAPGTPLRAQVTKWLVWMSSTLQSTLLLYFYPERWVNPGNSGAADEVRARAEARVGELLEQLDAQVAAAGGPWLLGERYSIADAYALVLCRWTRGFGRPARTYAHLGPYLQRMLARPAVKRVLATEKIGAPLV
ncbi:MAG: glutathione S-transferase family protein [Burkholderiales bacterium]|nr:glutathione S-transferase family protein [Burkholderiales bacterium]